MNVLRCLGERFFKKTTLVFFVFLSVAACAAEKGYPEKPPTHGEPQPLAEVTFTIDVDGKIDVKGVPGTTVEECSLDPASKDHCSIFDKNIQVEELKTFVFMRYKGSDCVIVGYGVRAHKVCGKP